jgi:16S rRNA (uracil1498-N3)-methyltransferase
MIDMAPFFYIPHIPQTASIELDADTSHHIAQVLRMQVGEALHITDGLGNKVTGILQVVSKKACCLLAEQRTSTPWSGRRVHLAIAPVKNNSRFEWFIEKATELGVCSIQPIITDRTEKQHLRMDRLRQVSIAAMLQSQQVWLPVLHEPTPIASLIRTWETDQLQRYIAHCIESEKKSIADLRLLEEAGMLIGPEGDFTAKEIQTALDAGFEAVQLGTTRLRTETAGVVAATCLRLQKGD